jgi:putative ABC transport system substrate-binding protein
MVLPARSSPCNVWRAAMVLLVSLVLGAAPAAADTPRTRVVALVSHDAAPYKEALVGLQQQMTSGAQEVQLDVHFLQGDNRAAPAVLQTARDGAAVIVALGTAAAQIALSGEGQTPVVAAMVFNSDLLRRTPSATAVVLDMPLEAQFDWLRKMLPDYRTVGVLYNPKENQQRVDAASRVAQQRGLKLIARPVDGPQDLPGALDSLSRQIDVLWSMTDAVVISPQTAQPILLFSFRNRIPLIGLSSTWVKAGALYSLDWDYGDIGRQTGELVQRILRGTKPADLPPASPRKLTYAVNMKSAQQLGVALPPTLVQGARQVFE